MTTLQRRRSQRWQVSVRAWPLSLRRLRISTGRPIRRQATPCNTQVLRFHTSDWFPCAKVRSDQFSAMQAVALKAVAAKSSVFARAECARAATNTWRALLDDRSLADVAFVPSASGAVAIRAHRAILAAASRTPPWRSSSRLADQHNTDAPPSLLLLTRPRPIPQQRTLRGSSAPTAEGRASSGPSARRRRSRSCSSSSVRAAPSPCGPFHPRTLAP